MELNRFKEIIEEFVANNFCADGCKECHELCHNLIPDDHKGSYDKAIKEFLLNLNEVKKGDWLKVDDEIIEVNKTNFSLRKILEEDGWKTYCKASEKVKSITKLMVRMDLSAMEIGFARLNKLTSGKTSEVKQ